MNDVDNFLAHHGVRGMKWGRRKHKPPTTDIPKGEVILTKECKNGTRLTITKVDRTSKMDRKLAAKDSQYADELKTWHNFDFTNKEGLKVGQASFHQSSPTALELEWIGVKKAHRSNGYARAALEGVIDYSKANGITDLELSATKLGKPLYEKLGFVEGPDRVHRLHIPSEIQHSDDTMKSLADYIIRRINSSPELNQEETLAMADKVDNFLAHYGVVGMKWGRRRSKAGVSHVSKRARQATKNHTKRDLAITASLGAAMVATMALSSISAAQVRGHDAARARQIHNNFSDVMGLPISSIKLSYNPTTNVWG